MKILLCTALLLQLGWAATAPVIRDAQGRHIFLRGFVMVTEDGLGPFEYGKEDYARAVRLGANFQVIRITVGKLGGWEGYQLDQAYLQKLDRMVSAARDAGMSTIFKLTVYDVKGFGDAGWARLWRNEHGEQERLIAGWTALWKRYKDDNSVFGYDLLNEPYKGPGGAYEEFERNSLVPTYRKIIDALQAVSPDKWALYQPALLAKEDHAKPTIIPSVEMRTPIERKHIIFAPHPYMMADMINAQLDRFLEEAAISDAPVIPGEWGRPPNNEIDASWDRQMEFEKMYIATAHALDSRLLGGIKPWFLGARQNRKPDWGMFWDLDAAGTAERKYVMDVVARPGPLAINGTVETFGFNFATREFSMRFQPGTGAVESLIYVPADRYYPDGFSIDYNQSVTITLDQAAGAAVRVIKGQAGADVMKVRWDPWKQRLCIAAWPSGSRTGTLCVYPGRTGTHPRAAAVN